MNPYLRFFSIRCNGIALAFAHVRIVADTLAEGAGDDTIRLASAESPVSQRSPWCCAQAGAVSPAGFTARSVARGSWGTMPNSHSASSPTACPYGASRGETSLGTIPLRERGGGPGAIRPRTRARHPASLRWQRADISRPVAARCCTAGEHVFESSAVWRIFSGHLIAIDQNQNGDARLLSAA